MGALGSGRMPAVWGGGVSWWAITLVQARAGVTQTLQTYCSALHQALILVHGVWKIKSQLSSESTGFSGA